MVGTRNTTFGTDTAITALKVLSQCCVVLDIGMGRPGCETTSPLPKKLTQVGGESQHEADGPLTPESPQGIQKSIRSFQGSSLPRQPPLHFAAEDNIIPTPRSEVTSSSPVM